jgi:hypothetical protein
MAEFLIHATKPIRARLDRKPSLRPDHFELLRQAWDSMPQKYRLANEATGNHKHFRFNEARLFPADVVKETWSEQGVAIQLNVLNWRSGELQHHVQPLVLVSLHALGRWFERSGSNDADRLLLDLKPLIYADQKAKRVPCGSGTWIAELVTADRDGTSDHVLRIKTFIEL